MKRIYSLKKKEEIDQIFNSKKSVGHSYLSIYYETYDQPHFKYAISIGKKYGNAVNRNLAKRRIRYVLSINKDKIHPNVSFVVVVKPKANTLSYQKLSEMLTSLLYKSKILKKEES